VKRRKKRRLSSQRHSVCHSG